jgi:hypothetical protein
MLAAFAASSTTWNASSASPTHGAVLDDGSPEPRWMVTTTPTSVTCPAGRRSSQTVELDLRPGQEQRLSLHAVDAEPGALVEVGVSTR